MQAKKAKKVAESFGLRLKEIRESRALSQAALARRAGLTSPAVAQIEGGRRKPSFDTLVALAQGLEISLDSLVGLSVPAESNAVLGDVAVMGLAEKVTRMPPELQAEVKDFVDFLWEKKVRARGRKKKRGSR